ncbi:MAG: hypothetical protein RXN77_07500 [Sulfolobaceae archaeon]|nr:hypothetical protein [Sulfolobales archaeon]
MIDWRSDGFTYIAVLAVGEEGNKITKTHKAVVILSKLLGVKLDEEAYRSLYSRVVAERMSSGSGRLLFVKLGDRYELTSLGKEVYYELLEQLKAKRGGDFVKLLKALREMSDKQLTALARSLLPEAAAKSATRGRIEETVAPSLPEGIEGFRTEGEGDGVTLKTRGSNASKSG